MKIGLVAILIILHGPLGATPSEAEPFWRRKAKLFQQMKERRKIVVSSDLVEEKAQKNVKIVGAGVVNVPLYFALEQVMAFEELPEVSSYFKKVVHKPEDKEVYFSIEALGMQARFLQKYQWGKKTSDQAQMDWQITWGTLKGMEGHYQFRRVNSHQTEVAIWASQKNISWPVPDFMINFTLEVIAEKTAQKMRSFIEKSYRQHHQRGMANEK